MFTKLPAEVQETIILLCAIEDPKSVSALGQVCHSVHALIGNPTDQHLWRTIFLSIFDDPRPILAINSGKTEDEVKECNSGFNWMLEAQRRFRAAFRMERSHTEDEEDFDEIVDEDAANALMDVALQALPFDEPKSNRGDCEAEVEIKTEDRLNVVRRGLPSRNGPWLEDILKGTVLPEPTTQHRAKLYVLASCLPIFTSASFHSTETSRTRVKSRAYTYDLRNYTEESDWGPWLPVSNTATDTYASTSTTVRINDMDEDDDDDPDWNGDGSTTEIMKGNGSGAGEINWIHLWHLMNVVRHNAHERHHRDIPCHDANCLRAYSVPIPDPAPDSISKGNAGTSKIEEGKDVQWNDWAGVQGVWLRAISFMDYRDLQEYNFSGNQPDGSLPTRVFEGRHFAEAFRLIKAHFIITKVESRGPEKYPHRPTIHFVGETTIPSHPLDTNTYRITKGTVRMTDSGNIKWSFVTRVGGHTWASEGAQLGAVQSAAGVIGVWSSADHDEADPAGPFWLWKLSESPKKAMKPAPIPRFHVHLILQHDD